MLLHLVIRPDVWTESRAVRKLPTSLSRASSRHTQALGADISNASGASTTARPISPSAARAPPQPTVTTQHAATTSGSSVQGLFAASAERDRASRAVYDDNGRTSSSPAVAEARQDLIGLMPSLSHVLGKHGADETLREFATLLHDTYAELYEQLWHEVYGISGNDIALDPIGGVEASLDEDLLAFEAAAFGWSPLPSLEALTLLNGAEDSRPGTLSQRVDIE